MVRTFLAHSPAKGDFNYASLGRGIGWGVIGGLVATLVMDFLLMGTLWAVGKDPFSCFTIVGDTLMSFFSALGVTMPGGVPAGVATHYSVGPLLGAIFGAATTQIAALRTGTVKRRVIVAVLFIEIISQPMLALTPLFLKTATSLTLLWYAGSFVMHFICGIVLGVIVSHGLRLVNGNINEMPDREMSEENCLSGRIRSNN